MNTFHINDYYILNIDKVKNVEDLIEFLIRNQNIVRNEEYSFCLNIEKIAKIFNSKDLIPNVVKWRSNNREYIYFENDSRYLCLPENYNPSNLYFTRSGFYNFLKTNMIGGDIKFICFVDWYNNKFNSLFPINSYEITSCKMQEWIESSNLIFETITKYYNIERNLNIKQNERNLDKILNTYDEARKDTLKSKIKNKIKEKTSVKKNKSKK